MARLGLSAKALCDRRFSHRAIAGTDRSSGPVPRRIRWSSCSALTPTKAVHAKQRGKLSSFAVERCGVDVEFRTHPIDSFEIDLPTSATYARKGQILREGGPCEPASVRSTAPMALYLSATSAGMRMPERPTSLRPAATIRKR